MLKIGIIGGEEILNTANLLKDVFLSKGMITKTSKLAPTNASAYNSEFGIELNDIVKIENADVHIEKIYINDNLDNNIIENNFDILIVNSINSNKNINIVTINKNDDNNNNIILLNSDEKNISKSLSKNSRTSKIITYGLNNRACVTASSISGSALQCCIQRALPTFSGETLEQQEFTVKIDTLDNDINAILASVTASLVSVTDKNFDLLQ